MGALRWLFYVLALVNFGGYVWVEPAFWEPRVWAALVALFAAEGLALAWHYERERARRGGARPRRCSCNAYTRETRAGARVNAYTCQTKVTKL
jgi:hypothetical protein